MLSANRIWKKRLTNIGVITYKNALNLGFSGPMLRSCGVPWDLRLIETYEIYSFLPITIPYGSQGDCYD